MKVILINLLFDPTFSKKKKIKINSLKEPWVILNTFELILRIDETKKKKIRKAIQGN